MAPSLRRSKATATSTVQSTLKPLSFGRVTKASQLNIQLGKVSDAKKAAIELSLGEKDIKQESPVETSQNRHVKRKRYEIESDDESGKPDVLAYRIPHLKKPKLLLLSPPSSQNNTDTETSSPIKLEFHDSQLSTHGATLPSTLQSLVSLHAALVRALSLHYAHNGPSTPAELNALMDSMTRIWKKSSVSKEMVQRMLALYEIAANTSLSAANDVQHEHGPFKLVTSGLGTTIRTNLEFVDIMNDGVFREHKLQSEYEKIVHILFTTFQSDPTSFIHQNHSQIPLLVIPVGAQTQARQAIASARRDEILQLSGAAQARTQLNFSSLSLSDELSASTPASVKSRTASLFDRVRAKGLAASANTAPTNDQILRRHAIGRIAEVVEFLRMKQQQKQGSNFHSSIHDSPSKARAKISFSLHSIVNEIKQSVAIPIGDQELRCCIKILSQAVPNWVSCFEMGSVTSITLVGSGMSGIEVKRIVELKERAS